MRHTHQGRRLAASFALALLAACSSTKTTLYGANREQLAAASKQIETGQLEAASARLDGLLLSTVAEPGPYGAQRYYAAFLLTRIHQDAALTAPFLEQPRTSRRGTRMEPSWLAHLVASIYESSYAMDWSSHAVSAPAALDGQDLLPPDLAAYGYENTQYFLDFNSLIVFGRLNFQYEVKSLLDSRPELLDVGECEAFFRTTQLSPAAQPWVLWTIHEHLRRRDEPLAYKFGIRARELGRDSGGAFPGALGDEIADWIVDDARTYLFVSSANLLFDRGADSCPESEDPNIEFRAVPRDEYTP